MGDFNADYNRQNRFDSRFRSFLQNNNLKFIRTNNSIKHTYVKGSYKALLDYILIPSILIHAISNSEIIMDDTNLSDHLPISSFLTCSSDYIFQSHLSSNSKISEFIELAPNLNNIEVKDKFIQKVKENLSNYNSKDMTDMSNKQ